MTKQELNASITPTSVNTSPLWRHGTASQGAMSTADAMTEPRPRLTNTIGSVQHTSVVNDDASPNSASRRVRMIPPSVRDTPRPTGEPFRSAAARDAGGEDRVVA